MGKTTSTIAVLLVLIFCGTRVLAADLQQGVLGLKWGADISNCPDLSKLSSKNDVDFYLPNKRGGEIEGVKVNRLACGFYTDKFFAVYGTIATVERFEKMKSHFTAMFGPPKTSLRQARKTYGWKHRDIKVKLKAGDDGSDMKLGIYYKPLAGKVNEVNQEKALERSLRFFPIEKGKKPKLVPILQY